MSTTAVQLRSRVPRFAGAAVERARLTVVPRRRARRAGPVPFVALVSLVLLAGVVGLLLFNTSMQQASFAATALEGQARTLAAREQTLQMELEALRNPQQVALTAQKLGMVPGCPQPAFLDLRNGEVRGEPCSASPANGLRLQPRLEAPPASRVVTVPAGEIPTDDTSDGAGGTAVASGTDGNSETRATEQRER